MGGVMKSLNGLSGTILDGVKPGGSGVGRSVGAAIGGSGGASGGGLGSPLGGIMGAAGDISAGAGAVIGGAVRQAGGIGAMPGLAGRATQAGSGGLGGASPLQVQGLGAVLSQLGPGKLVDPKIGALVGQAGDVGPHLHKILVSSVLRQDAGSAFCALLLATVKKVNEKKHFNLEVEINDLLVKLGNLRDPHLPAVGPSPSSKKVSAKVVEAIEALSHAAASH